MNHIKQIQKKIIETDIGALLITNEKNQYYACGFAFTDGYVLITRDNAWLITDSRYIEAAEQTVDPYVHVVLYDRSHNGEDHLRNILKSEKTEHLFAEDQQLSYAQFASLSQTLGMSLMPSCNLLADLRSSKDEDELQNMINAQRISEAALEATLPIIRPGMTEREVAAELVYHMLKNGGEGNSFDPIVVTGKNTSKPHGVPGDTVIMPGDFLTMDFGCIKNGYCSDMTRTVAVCSASDEMRNLYATVLKAQLAGISAARAGILGSEIDSASRAVIQDAGFGPYFGHGFGHSLGLDIHEGPYLNPRESRFMPENSVCSAEPGIYLPGRYGVRIEDVMILRSGGSEVITKAPKQELIIVGR